MAYPPQGYKPTKHSHKASDVTSERFSMARMPDGTSGYVLTAKGSGVDPAYQAIAVGTTVQITQAVGSTSNPTTTSGDWAQIPEMAVTINNLASGDKVEVSLNVLHSNNTAGAVNYFGIQTAIATPPTEAYRDIHQPHANERATIHLQAIFTELSGTVTFYGLWAVGSGTLTANSTRRNLIVKVFKA